MITGRDTIRLTVTNVDKDLVVTSEFEGEKRTVVLQDKEERNRVINPLLAIYEFLGSRNDSGVS